MLEERTANLLSLLSQDTFRTAAALSDKMQVGMKTLRQTMKQLNEILSSNGAHIEKEPSKGYLLKVDDFEEFQSLFQQDENRLPDSSKERVEYLLEYFLNHDEYVKAEELSDILYVSKRTLATDLKKVEQTLKHHQLEIERKPYYGMRITGDEFHIRQCIAKVKERKQKYSYWSEAYDTQEIPWISEALQDLLESNELEISDIALQNLIIHIWVAIKRIHSGQYAPLPPEDYHKWVGEQEYQQACKLVSRLAEKFHVEFPEGEIVYIAIHFASKGKSAQVNTSDNQVISCETAEIVRSMLEEIYQTFQIDLRDDLELSVALGRHLGPLEVRIRYGMHLKNPLLEQIKERYSLAYVMATQAGAVLRRYFKKLLDPDELAYIALALELALERQRTQRSKKNILLVCASGEGTAKLLGFKLQEMFRDCIENVFTCDEHSIKYQDFTKINYVFTTVPIRTPVPVPISEMKLFWEREDIAFIREILTSSTDQELMQYYPKELFFTGISFPTKKDVLQFMCEEMKEKGWVEEDFFEAVMKREEIGVTCLDNSTAMPHPCQTMTENTFVSVSVLDEPVEWIEGQFVQVVFLISASTNKELDLQDFYLTVARLLLDKQSIKTLIEKKDYKTLQDLIKQISISAIN